MGNKKSKPRMYGLVVGIVVGVIIGFIQRDWIRKSLSGEFVHVLNTLTLIITSCIGYAIGRMVDKMGKRRTIS